VRDELRRDHHQWPVSQTKPADRICDFAVWLIGVLMFVLLVFVTIKALLVAFG
jgi:hypothetical protein